MDWPAILTAFTLGALIAQMGFLRREIRLLRAEITASRERPITVTCERVGP